MSFFNSINVSASGLTAERTRMDIISQNMANVNTTRTSNGTPYRRKMVLIKENNNTFENMLSKYTNSAINSDGVKVSKIVEDKTPLKSTYEPGHPDADENGYVKKPNVDIVKEMVDMISASRGYEANITALNSSKTMAMKALSIGK